jgi:putative ABC transport system permease protein
MIKAIDKKLVRDLWRMRGQVFAIIIVIAAGVATFVMSLSTLESLKGAQAGYYEEYRFAEAFISLKRAPASLVSRIEAVSGVERAEARVVAAASIDLLDFNGFKDPVTARLVSIPDNGQPLMNALFLREGRLVESGRDDEVVVSETFAKAHGLKPNDKLRTTINGRQRSLTITGIALSPEFIYQIRPGALIPDFERFATLWMGRTPLSMAYDMEGAFNDVVMRLSTGANLEEVIDSLDTLIEPYGGLGAYGRDDQLSHRYLSEEFKSLKRMAWIFPVIFLAVAAFLLNVVVGRMVGTQREQIALLKAFGYTNLDVALHYLRMVFIVVILGVIIGVASGVWLGNGLSNMYMRFYNFPFLDYTLTMPVVTWAVAVSIASATAGTIFAVRRAALLSPAEAMRPEPPASYREALVERAGLKWLFSQSGRMILRHLERRPVKSLLTITGIALSCAILIMGDFFGASVDYMVEVSYSMAAHEDLTVSFTEPASMKAVHELKSMKGVHYVEPFRAVPARLSFGHRSYRTVVQGLKSDARLHQLLDKYLEPIELPEEGVVLTDHLAKILAIKPGETLTIEALEGSRPVREVQVVRLVKEYIGVSAYMELGALNRLMREGSSLSGAYLFTDPAFRDDINERLKNMPRVAGTVNIRDQIKNFYDTMGEQVFIFTFFMIILAGTITFGVVYNSARIALSERSRELASLRVLGFTRAEISYILLGELAVLTGLAIPLGFLFGRLLCMFMIANLQSDLFRIPLVMEARTYAFATLVVVVSAVLSSLIVRRRLDHLDLVEVLKTKE